MVNGLLLDRIIGYESKNIERDSETGAKKADRRKILDKVNMDPKSFSLFLKDLFLKHEAGSWDGNQYTWARQWRYGSFEWITHTDDGPAARLKCPICGDTSSIGIEWTAHHVRTVSLNCVVEHVLRHFSCKQEEFRYRCGKRYNQFFKALHWNARADTVLQMELQKYQEGTPEHEAVKKELIGGKLEPDEIYYAGQWPLLGLPVAGRIPYFSGKQNSAPPVNVEDVEEMAAGYPPLSVELEAPGSPPGNGMEMD